MKQPRKVALINVNDYPTTKYGAYWETACSAAGSVPTVNTGGGAPLRDLPNFSRRRKSEEDEPAEPVNRQQEAAPRLVEPTPEQRKLDLAQTSKLRETLRQQVSQGDALAALAVEALIENAEQQALLAEQAALLSAQQDDEMQAIALILAIID